ncbi:hypothetical protein KV557_25115 [Kitasatospora aureofaciens]|uniref:hypothetical protein n=1 Tax=Kitasatospora aureofaciens TaxID=1894 RepID=UPI001C49518F|nr:hypothetical protein [Kitasatospora aureofaciens]MBV6700347.1 hypothetical protein [Kitasatospora aureofaciens]
MSLRETPVRAPEQRAVNAGVCLPCVYFRRAARQYPAMDYPMVARQLARSWQQHVDDGECLVGESGDG